MWKDPSTEGGEVVGYGQQARAGEKGRLRWASWQGQAKALAERRAAEAQDKAERAATAAETAAATLHTLKEKATRDRHLAEEAAKAAMAEMQRAADQAARHAAGEAMRLMRMVRP